MLALKIIGAVVLICFLIGRIRVGVDLNVIDGKLTLSAKVCGILIQLLPKKKRNEKSSEKQSKEESPKKEPEKKQQPAKEKKIRKKKKPFFKIDIYDLKEMLSKVTRGLKKFGKGFNCDRLLIDFTAASWDPYITAELFTYVNAFLSAFAPVFEERNDCRNCNVRTQIDFNAEWPKLNAGICITLRIGAVFAMLFTILFGVLWVFIKIVFRFLWMKFFDKEEYDFRMNQQEGPVAFFKRVIREGRELKNLENNEENIERKSSDGK